MDVVSVMVTTTQKKTQHFNCNLVMLPMTATLFFAACSILSLHQAKAFSFHSLTLRCPSLTSLKLAWYDDYEEDSRSGRRRTSTAPRGGGRTSSTERSGRRSTSGRDRGDWDRSSPRRQQWQQQPKIREQRTPILSRTREQPSSGSIDCPHFGTCPGCAVNNNIALIDIVESSKLYFSSQSVQKHILPSKARDTGFYDEDEFYKVVIPSSITEWRSQAKLAVAPKSTWSRASGALIGLYARHTHDVLSIPDCKVHHPSINRAVNMIVEATKKVRTPVFLEDIGDGLLRYIQLQVELSTGKVCLTLIMNAEKLKECQPHLSFLVKELKRMDPKREVWHSIWCHCNNSSGNAIFSRDSTRWHPIEGPSYVCEKIPGSDPDVKEGLLYFSPMVFRQGNLEGFGEIARKVREAIPGGSKVCEMYAGVGLLGLSSLLYHGKQGTGLKWLRCSDENPENLRCFEMAVNSMPMHITGRTPKSFEKDRGGKGRGSRQQRGRRDSREISIKEMMENLASGNVSEESTAPSVTYNVANAASALFEGQALGADVLIVDPPRKGLDEPVLKQFCQRPNPNQPYAEEASMLLHLPRHTINWANDVRTLIYVSCGFDALARDCDALLSSNAGWKLESVTGYVLFPGSNHVETVVVFQR